MCQIRSLLSKIRKTSQIAGNIRIVLLLVLMVVSIFNRQVSGQNIDQLDIKTGIVGPSTEGSTPPIPSNVEFVSKVLQTELKKDSLTIGKVEDVALDLETEHLALLVASNRLTNQSKRYALLPFIPGDKLVQYDWENKLTLQTPPLSAARAEVADLYRDYKQALYWIEFAKKKLSNTHESFDEEKFALTFYSTLKGKRVADNIGESVGKISDVAIKSSSGEVLYVVMISEDGATRAIPLGAFVNEEKKDEWLIELGKEQIFNFKPFLAKTPPIRVDRGWEEYVSVRYGRGGLQARKKVEISK